MVPIDGEPAATHSYGTNQTLSALKYIDVLKSQTVESHSHLEVPETHTTPK